MEYTKNGNCNKAMKCKSKMARKNESVHLTLSYTIESRLLPLIVTHEVVVMHMLISLGFISTDIYDLH